MASFYFRYGVMKSGKSVHLMQVAHNYEEKDMKVALLKPNIDKKGDDYVISRVGIKRKVDYLVDENKELKEYLDNLEDVKCIIVDEAQFLSPENVDTLYEYNKKNNVPVICYGLKSDFRTHAFPGSIRLFELADVMEELVTICECGRKAKFNARVVDGEYILHGEQVAIDGIDASYEVLCGNCYRKKVLKIDK